MKTLFFLLCSLSDLTAASSGEPPLGHPSVLPSHLVKDNHEHCAAWAANKECVNRPEFMLRDCVASCKKFLPDCAAYQAETVKAEEMNGDLKKEIDLLKAKVEEGKIALEAEKSKGIEEREKALAGERDRSAAELVKVRNEVLQQAQASVGSEEVISSLKAEIASIQTKLTLESANLDQEKKKVANLNTQIQELQTRSGELHAQQQSLPTKEEVEKLYNDVRESESQLKEVSEKVIILEARAVAAEKRAEEGEAKAIKTASSAACTEATARLKTEGYEGKCLELENKNKELEEKLKNLEEDLSGERVKQVEEKKAVIEKELEQSQKAVIEAKNEYKTAIEALQVSFHSAKRDRDSCNQKVLELEKGGVTTSTGETTKRLQDAVSSCTDMMQNLQNEHYLQRSLMETEYGKEINELKEEMEKMKAFKEPDDATASVSAAIEKLKESEQKVKESEGKLLDTEQKLSQSESKLQACESKENECSTNVITLQNEVGSLKTLNSTVTQDCEGKVATMRGQEQQKCEESLKLQKDSEIKAAPLSCDMDLKAASEQCETEKTAIKNQQNSVAKQQVADNSELSTALEEAREARKVAEAKSAYLEANYNATTVTEDCDIKVAEALADKHSWTESNRQLEADLLTCQNALKSATGANARGNPSCESDLLAAKQNNEDLSTQVLSLTDEKIKLEGEKAEQSQRLSYLQADLDECLSKKSKQMGEIQKLQQQVSEGVVEITPKQSSSDSEISPYACGDLRNWCNIPFFTVAGAKIASFLLDLLLGKESLKGRSYSEETIIFPFLSTLEATLSPQLSPLAQHLDANIFQTTIQPLLLMRGVERGPDNFASFLILVVVIIMGCWIAWKWVKQAFCILSCGLCCSGGRRKVKPPRERLVVKAAAKVHAFDSDIMQF